MYGAVNGFEGRPTGSQLQYIGVIEGQLSAARLELTSLVAKELPALNAALESRKLEPLKLLTREEWEKQTSS